MAERHTVRTQYEQALGYTCRLPDANRVNERIYELIGSPRVLILRNDAIVNPEPALLGPVPAQACPPCGGLLEANGLYRIFTRPCRRPTR